jgi:hypothetical protein
MKSLIGYVDVIPWPEAIRAINPERLENRDCECNVMSRSISLGRNNT